jgi:hypothetical protein
VMKRSKPISMKKLYSLGADWNYNYFKNFEHGSKDKDDLFFHNRRVLDSFLRYVFEHRND